jgi:hypothetical protein
MAIKKSDSAGKSRAITKAGNGNPKKATQIDQESQNDDREPIYVKISKEARAILKKVATGSLTNAKVIEALLENYQRQHQDDKEKILSGQLINPRQEFEDLIAKLHKAQSAFENKRYFLAAKYYKDIVNGLNSSEKLRDVCNYRLGICWIRLSYELRKEALKNDSDYERYNLASDATDKASEYLKKVKDSEDVLPTLLKHYNLACCHSLKAQYMVESRLDPKSDLIDGLRKAKQDSTMMEKAWSNIGEVWRGIYKGRNVDSEAQEAMNELQEIYSIPSSKTNSTDMDLPENSDLSSEGIWFVGVAWEDEDFIFMRSDKQKWQPKFKEWHDSALSGEKSIADAIRTLLYEK